MRSPISKINRPEWTGSVTQVIEHLLCRHGALSSNSMPTKGKKKRDIVRINSVITTAV
jgi:hypothetical protein